MAIQSRKNQYIGVNAHLSSLLQNETAGWPIFHNAHVVDLTRAVDRALPPGYVVVPERSLQIREFHPDTGEPIERRRRKLPKPDISVYQRPNPNAQAVSSPAAVATPTLTIEHLDAFDDPEIYLTAITIHEIDENRKIGNPITWIELLSPTNKPFGSGYLQYQQKRIATTKAGIVLVEVDYLHQSPPVEEAIPSYMDGETDAYAYHIAITDLREQSKQPQLQVYGFSVDAAMPILNIPLAADDAFRLDCSSVYNQTYESISFYSSEVDYEQLPVRFETYSEADQARIKARMQAVQESHQHGANLEDGPFVI